MRVLITRPRDDAEALAATLARRGIESLIEPMLDIAPLPGAAVDLDDIQAILLTSANGARSLAAATPRRDLAVLAVGPATAAAATASGFADVTVAGGDVDALAALAAARLDPGGAPLIHVSGSVVAGDLAGQLARHGFALRRARLYEARPATVLSATAGAALTAGEIDAVMFFSPRTASAFVRLVNTAGLAPTLSAVRGLCLSAAVAAEAGTLTWCALCVASRPDQDSLLALLED